MGGNGERRKQFHSIQVEMPRITRRIVRNNGKSNLENIYYNNGFVESINSNFSNNSNNSNNSNLLSVHTNNTAWGNVEKYDPTATYNSNASFNTISKGKNLKRNYTNRRRKNKNTLEYNFMFYIMNQSAVPHLRNSNNFFTLGSGINRTQGGKNEARRIIQVIDENFKYFCAGINPLYVLRELKTCDVLMIAYEPEKKKRILGFAAMTIEGPGHLYISIICTNNNYKGMGGMMLDKIKDFASLMQTHDGYVMNYPAYKITLNSVPDMVGFYKKQGFEVNVPMPDDDSEDDYGDVAMTFRNTLNPVMLLKKERK